MLAAADSPASPSLALLLLLVFLVYGLSVAVWPWRKCLACNDKKKFFAPWSGSVFHMCPRCHGKGKEFRVVARVWRGLFGHGWDRHN